MGLRPFGMLELGGNWPKSMMNLHPEPNIHLCQVGTNTRSAINNFIGEASES